ncbi:MAG: 50S ribosomal protein L21 [Ignavibacteriales bacterium]|nr:50S ribosomal protein L21 [Ignavibacteriales bacterium]
MFAVVDIAGQQVKVTKNTKYYVPKLDAEVESEVTFSNVLLVKDGENAAVIGTPFVDGRSVTAKVLQHLKDDKIIVFKKKRRISYRRLRGHRQQLTQIQVTNIA